MTLWLTQQILKEYKRDGFISALVFGKQGNGKTTYALITAKEVYEKLGYENPWKTALDRLYFESPFESLLKSLLYNHALALLTPFFTPLVSTPFLVILIFFQLFSLKKNEISLGEGVVKITAVTSVLMSA